MPLLSSTPTKEKKLTQCHAATPTPSLRRVPVKPLGEHNRSRSHSPALGSLSANTKRTPGRAQQQQQQQSKLGVDLTRRFADSMAATATSRGASPRGSPSLDRIQEGCASMGREQRKLGVGAAFKSRLRGGEDSAPPVKKAIFPGKEKKLPARQREHFVLDHASLLEKSPFSDFSLPKSSQRGKAVETKVVAKVISGVGHRSFGARSETVWKNPPRSPDQDAMLAPLTCNSPEVCNRGSVTWEPREDVVAWSRDMVCFESFSKGSKTPEAQPSKSPELTRRAMMAEEASANLQTPSPQPTSSPEFLKRGSVPPSTGERCFGAGPLMGPEGMRSVKDRRKCKPRGILTIEGELLFTSGSADFPEENVTPALASVEWMVAQGYEVDTASPDASSPQMASPRSFDMQKDAAAPGHRRCRSAAESGGSDQIFWKKGLLYEWNLSLSDQKRADDAARAAEEDSPVGKLRDFSPASASRFSNIMGSSLVIGAFDTPSSGGSGASDLAGEDEVQSKYSIREEEDSVSEALQHLSMSFSLDSSPESGESWRGIRTSQSTAWGDSDSQGEWGEFLNRTHRYKSCFNSQFRFHSELTTPAPSSYSDEGDSVVCTPNSDHSSPWKDNKKDLDTPSPDDRLVGISISISEEAPSLDSSSEDFDLLRHRQVEEESKVAAPRGRVLLHEADYSPSSLLKADAFRASRSLG